MKFVKDDKRYAFNTYDLIDMKVLDRVPLDFSQLNKHKFRHSCKVTVSFI